ncbi:MAG: hypothetical protein H7Y32_14135 [Chloroflexales bacterium]|nr:hypothetical protein [Chloroflexales bacterium]
MSKSRRELSFVDFVALVPIAFVLLITPIAAFMTYAFDGRRSDPRIWFALLFHPFIALVLLFGVLARWPRWIVLVVTLLLTASILKPKITIGLLLYRGRP